MKMYDILRRGTALSAEKIAVRHGERAITYKKLLQSASTAANLLRGFELAEGSRIAIVSENCPEYVAVLFGIYGANHVAVPLDNSLKPDKIASILSDCEASAIYIQSKFLRHLDQILSGNDQVRFVLTDQQVNLETGQAKLVCIENLINNENDDFDLQSELADIGSVVSLENLTFESRPECEQSLAALFYTSGSTGAGKGVMLSHRNLISNSISTVDYLRLTSEDSVITILPFYYIYGNSLLLTHLLVGGTTVIDNRFAFPQAILDTMVNTEVTGFSGVPSNFMILLNHSNFNATRFPRLRYLTQAGGGMAPEIIRKVAERFQGKELFIMYGQTEAAPRISWLPPQELDQKLGSVGIPVPGVTYRIVGPSGEELSAGETGEVTISG
ncbi:MAG: class I adenylate-forming enzyme family protein, partial [bacterium]|nr:class I adenylate-forming enzyme family protein [bacterium]